MTLLNSVCRPYAESIERRLQKLSLLTHIVLLKEEAHVVPCVEDLTGRGVLYAVIITRQNEQHASCTLRLLYGVPQGEPTLRNHSSFTAAFHRILVISVDNAS